MMWNHKWRSLQRQLSSLVPLSRSSADPLQGGDMVESGSANRSTQNDLGEWFSLATTMDEVAQGHTAPLHAVSRAKWLLNMTTIGHILVPKAHDTAKLYIQVTVFTKNKINSTKETSILCTLTISHVLSPCYGNWGSHLQCNFNSLQIQLWYRAVIFPLQPSHRQNELHWLPSQC